MCPCVLGGGEGGRWRGGAHVSVSCKTVYASTVEDVDLCYYHLPI